MSQKQQVKAKEKTGTVEMAREKLVRTQLLEANAGIETGYLTMAELLSETMNKEYFTKWGFESFQDYTEKELEVDDRKAKYLISIWNSIKVFNLPKARLQKIGWTKAKDLIAVMTKKNAEKLLNDAEKMTSREFGEMVQTMRRATGKSKGPVTLRIAFSLGESEHKIVTEALDEAKKLCNSDNLSLALEMICQDWLADKGARPETTHLSDHIQYLEKIYPVKISYQEVKPKKKEKEEEKKEPEEKVTKGKAKTKEEKKASGKKEKEKEAEPKKKEKNIDDLLNE